MAAQSNKTVMLIHGAWMVPASWDGFRSRAACSIAQAAMH